MLKFSSKMKFPECTVVTGIEGIKVSLPCDPNPVFISIQNSDSAAVCSEISEIHWRFSRRWSPCRPELWSTTELQPFTYWLHCRLLHFWLWMPEQTQPPLHVFSRSMRRANAEMPVVLIKNKILFIQKLRILLSKHEITWVLREWYNKCLIMSL